MTVLVSGLAGAFPYRIEERPALARGLTVLAYVLDIRPAIEAFEAAVAWRDGQELRLRRDTKPAVADYREMNFAVAEWDDAGHVVTVHGLFLSIAPAQAAYAAVRTARLGAELTLHHHGRVLESAA